MEGAIQSKQLNVEPRVWQNKNFLLLWAAGLLSSFGMSVFMFSQSWYVVRVLGLEASIGLIFVASSIPRLIFMLFGGAMADRMSKTKIMWLSDFTRSLIALGIVIWLLYGTVSLWSFVLCAFIFGILDAFFYPAENALIPSIVKKENLTRANSIIQMTNQSSFILGPMIAGIIISWGSYPMVFSTTAFFMLISGIFILTMKIKMNQTDPSDESSNILMSIKDGMKYVKQSRFLSTLLVVAVFLNLFMVGPLQMGLPLFVDNVLRGSTMDYSYLEGSLAIGMLVGSIIVGVLNVKKKRGKFMILGLGVSGMSFLMFSMTNNLWLSLIVIILFGSTFPIINIPVISSIQEIVEDNMIGRVMSLVSFASMGLIPVSYVLTSLLLGTGLNITQIMFGGAFLILMFVVVILTKIPILRDFD
ncbi:MFS transporter [Bacillaceae bacterium S4-13-58]